MSINYSKKMAHDLMLHTGIVILFLLLSFVINKIPDGTFIASGDFYQLININDNLDRYLFTWFNQLGQGQYNPLIVAFPFYAFQSILYNFGFSYANIANTIMFIFFIGSFYSFYFAARIIDVNITNNVRILSSAIYAINIFTFTIFTYSWGFTHHYIVYIFIPILFALFEKLISNYSRKNIAYFTILFLISTMGFNNIAYLAAFLFLQVLVSIAFFATKKIPLTLKTTKRIFFILILQLLLSIYFILPFFASQVEYISMVTGGKVLGDISSIFAWTSNHVYGIFSFAIYSDKYPLNNLYSSSDIFPAISLGYIIILTIAILYNKSKQDKNWLHYLIILVVLLLLLMRGTPPFDIINIFIYSLPGFTLFRSPDKLFVFYPFFYLMLLSLLLCYSKFSKKMITTILILILIIPIPFYIGGIPTYLSHENQDGYKDTIQIPSEYYDIKGIINDDNRQLSIISLPYSVVTSLNWANYPKWHFVGHDVLHLLYNKLYISANTYDHPSLETNLTFWEYNEANIVNNDKFIKSLQKFSGRYILLHKDANKQWLDNSKVVDKTIKELESNNILIKLDENDYFTLYELDENYLIPLILSDNNAVDFQKINPIKYRINIHNITEKTNIEFHQSHNSQWKLYLESNPNNSWCKPLAYYENTKTTECEPTNKIFELNELTYLWKKPIFDDTHEIVSEYANGWTIDPEYIKENYPKEFYKENQDGSIEVEMVLYFKPQSYFYIGLLISTLILTLCIGYLLWDWRTMIKIKKTSNRKIIEKS
jgi:hypothetical protein